MLSDKGYLQSFRRVFLPYCLQQLADGRWIVLNRRYKPLGVASSDWVVYEEHPSAYKAKITKALRQKLDCGSSYRDDCIYLYENFEPKDKKFLAEYAARLALLEKIDVLP